MTKPFNKLDLPALSPTEYADFNKAKLKFNEKNSKLLKSRTAAFSLPAGYSCPGACKCLSWFDREKGKLQDGTESKFRCFAASQEAAFPNVRKLVDRNLAMLKEARTITRMSDLIHRSLPKIEEFENIRVHADGDFYNQSYFLAWMQTAERNPDRLFYAYTKSLPIWIRNFYWVPENFVLTASIGGKWDDLIKPNKLRTARVVYHPEEAEALGLEIDHDDSLARDAAHGDFCLLLHGQQAKGSESGAALKRMRIEGVKYAYGSGKNSITTK